MKWIEMSFHMVSLALHQNNKNKPPRWQSEKKSLGITYY